APPRACLCSSLAALGGPALVAPPSLPRRRMAPPCRSHPSRRWRAAPLFPPSSHEVARLSASTVDVAAPDLPEELHGGRIHAAVFHAAHAAHLHRRAQGTCRRASARTHHSSSFTLPRQI